MRRWDEAIFELEKALAAHPSHVPVLGCTPVLSGVGEKELQVQIKHFLAFAKKQSDRHVPPLSPA